MTRVAINPELLLWARERANLDLHDLETKFPNLGSWEVGEVQPTLKQVEAFARAVHVPVGYLFLSAPSKELLPIPDSSDLGLSHNRRSGCTESKSESAGHALCMSGTAGLVPGICQDSRTIPPGICRERHA